MENGYTVVLESPRLSEEGVYKDTALPFAGSSYRPPKDNIPERLREMRRLYEYGRESESARARNFYRQAVFMQDYEDDVPWTGEFVRYYPTYQDLTVQQLRGYFTWRTGVRKGVFQPTASSAAYLYLYELLNGIGAESPKDVLDKLKEFETGFLDSGIGDAGMRRNLRHWMLEYAVLNELPPELAQQAADPDLTERDAALSVLRNPEAHTDEEVFSALCTIGGKKTAESPVMNPDPERGRRLFSAVWRAASSYHWEDKDLFTLCFGVQMTRRWYPLSNAIYYERSRPKDRDFVLNECRRYSCRKGIWQVTAYERASFDRGRFQGFLHETDTRLRRYLKTGRYLRESPADAWAVPYIDEVIEADRKAVLEASRPKITIDLSGLDQIRRDALLTRDSLLTEEELQEQADAETAAEPVPAQEYPDAAEACSDPGRADDLPLDAVQIRILRGLLRGEDVSGLLRTGHLMPSITADLINESLFDEIGDTVVICEDDRLSLVEDYIEVLEGLLGGTADG